MKSLRPSTPVETPFLPLVSILLQPLIAKRKRRCLPRLLKKAELYSESSSGAYLACCLTPLSYFGSTVGNRNTVHEAENAAAISYCKGCGR